MLTCTKPTATSRLRTANTNTKATVLIHGHNWTIHLTFACEETDANGFVVDFGKLKFLKEWIDTHLDHACLLNEDDPEKDGLLEQFGHLFKAYVLPNCSSEGWHAPAHDPRHHGTHPQRGARMDHRRGNRRRHEELCTLCDSLVRRALTRLSARWTGDGIAVKVTTHHSVRSITSHARNAIPWSIHPFSTTPCHTHSPSMSSSTAFKAKAVTQDVQPSSSAPLAVLYIAPVRFRRHVAPDYIQNGCTPSNRITGRVARASEAEFAVITGGEPAIHDLSPLTDALHRAGLAVHLETSGAFPIRGRFDWITLSPKRWKLPLAENISRADEFKVIVDHAEAIQEYVDCLKRIAGGSIRSDLPLKAVSTPTAKQIPIWLHPEWSQHQNREILNAITDWIKTHGSPFRAGWQLHKHYAADLQDVRSAPAAPSVVSPTRDLIAALVSPNHSGDTRSTPCRHRCVPEMKKPAFAGF